MLFIVLTFFFLLGNSISAAQEQEQQQFTCPLSLLIPFHDERQILSSVFDDKETATRNSAASTNSASQSIITQEEHRRDGLTLLAIALMAIEDFNNRSSMLVPSINNLKECSLIFPTPTIFDTGRNPDITTAHKDVWFYNNNQNSTSYLPPEQQQQQHPCAIIGPKDNFVAQEVANILQDTIVPAISYGATATKLANDPYKYHNMVLGNVHWDDTIIVLLDYLKKNNHHHGGGGIAVLYEAGNNLDYDDYIQVWQNANVDKNLYIIMIQLISSRNTSQLTQRLSEIQQTTSIKTIVVALNRDDNLQEIADIANDLGLLSEDYTWIFMDTFVSPQYVEKLASSTTTSPSVNKLLKRLLLFQLLDGLVPFNVSSSNSTTTAAAAASKNNDKVEQLINSTILHHDFSHTEWIKRGTNSMIMQTMNRLLLNQSIGVDDDGDDDKSFLVDDQFFESNIPAYGSSFIYDAIMAIGITACASQSIIDASFDGATAATAYQFLGGGANRSLDVHAHVFGIFALEETANDNELKVILVDTNYNGGWTQLEEEEANNDGTTTGDNYYLSTASAAIGMTLASIGIVFCFISFGFLFYYRKNRIVSVSQPEFIYMVCVGASLVSLSIYFISFDDSTLEVDLLDAFCVIQLWFSRIGLLIVYSALFSKLWRVEKVSQFRRGQKIEVKHVLGPFAGLICICLVLLTVWSIVDPPRWERIDVDHRLVKEEGSVGSCNENVGFSLSIDFIIICAVALSLWMSNKAKHLPEDISDSSRVHQTLVAHLVLLMVGVVLMVFVAFFPSTNLLYLIRSIFWFLTTISSVAFIVVPKMYYVRRKALTGELPPGLQRGGVKVTGLKAPGTSSGSGSNKYSGSRFTVNQAHSPCASIMLGTAPSTTMRTESVFPSTASTAITNFSTRNIGLTSSVIGTSFRTLDSNGRGTSFRGLDSTVSGIERVGGNDLNSSYVSGMDCSDRASADLNASARSLNLNASTRSLLASQSPTSSDTHSPPASIDQTGQIKILSSSPPLFAPPTAEDRSENFVLHIEGDDDDEDHEGELKEEPPRAAESTKELSPRPPKRNPSIDSFLVPTIQEEQSEDFSVSIEGENIVGEK